jgi:transglutaminase-like putative cysteine protease
VSGRARPLDAAVAAVTTLAATLPLVTLFTPTAAWFRPSLLLVALVGVAGVGLRVLTSVRPVVVAGQAVVLVHGTALLHGQGHLWHGLVPVPETGQAVGILLGDAYATITNYSAPAPADRGVVLAVSLLVGATALAVDALAVTYRSPALAGIPLLSAFLASATNSGDGLAAWFVVPPAVGWLAMVGRQGVRSLRSWGTAAPRASGPFADPAAAYATVGRVAGVAALAAAVVLPSLVPHFPTTFLAEGLGRSDNGRGGGSSVRLSTSIDIARDLGDRSTDPILVYASTATNVPPLRVGVLDTYQRGRWTLSSDFTYVPLDGRLPGPSADPSVRRTTERITVSTNSVGVPQVALPENATGSPFPEGAWQVTTNGIAVLRSPVTQYSVEYVALAPADTDFDTGLAAGAPEREDLALDPRAESEVRSILADITKPGDSTIDVARQIQQYLRGPDFTYSEELADQTAEGSRPEEPLVRFLETKRGYCVQFASAMVMLARAAGIPARMAVGFLPGVLQDGQRTVRVSDAHAWPELYFPRLGWMRFEPTPGTRSGVAPTYSYESTGTGNAAPTSIPSVNASTSAGDSTRPQTDVTAGDPTTSTGGAASTVTRFVSDHVLAIAVVLLVLLAASVVPFGGWLARRRARQQARDDAERVEAEWQSLVSRLGDIGLAASDGATPRQASSQLGRAAYLTPEEGEALGRVVSTLERARYAPPGAELTDVQDDARTVWKAAFARRRRLDRARALLLPDEGLRWWRSLRPGRRPPPGGDHDED